MESGGGFDATRFFDGSGDLRPWIDCCGVCEGWPRTLLLGTRLVEVIVSLERMTTELLTFFVLAELSLIFLSVRLDRLLEEGAGVVFVLS